MEDRMTSTCIDRRKALTVVAAAPVAVVLGSGVALANLGDNRLLELIRLYRVQVKAIHDDCRMRDMEDGELDARCDQADALLDEAVSLPVLTAVGALLRSISHWRNRGVRIGPACMKRT
jgi:hypothetical protein